MAESVALKILNSQHWERPQLTEGLGCSSCLDRPVCGGIRPEADIFSCHDYCCENPKGCSKVCPKNAVRFVERLREVNGWDLGNIDRLKALIASDMPDSIPVIYHSSRREKTLRTKSVAIPLRLIINKSATLVQYANKTEVMQDLRIAPRAKIVIDGIGRDKLIENFWAERRSSVLIKKIAMLRPSWVITPNYSVLTDVPRWENLHAMKRIAIIWSEFMDAGVPTALTLNARTERDWERWTEFVISRPEVQAVAIELGTGGRYAERRDFILSQAASLGAVTGGRLRLFLRGGRSNIPRLQSSFESIHLLDTNPFMKTVYRQRITSSTDRTRSIPSATVDGKPIGDLLQANVNASL